MDLTAGASDSDIRKGRQGCHSLGCADSLCNGFSPAPLESSRLAPERRQAICLRMLVMPVTLTIDKTRRLTITTGRGVVTDVEFIEARQQLILHPDFDPCFDRIWNFHAVTESQVSEEIAAQLTADSPAAEKSICRAVVMSERSAPMKDILAFIGRTRKANRRIAAFPDLPSAEEWVLTARHDLPPE